MNTVINMGMHVFLQQTDFASSGFTQRSGDEQPYGSSVSTFFGRSI